MFYRELINVRLIHVPGTSPIPIRYGINPVSLSFFYRFCRTDQDPERR